MGRVEGTGRLATAAMLILVLACGAPAGAVDSGGDGRIGALGTLRPKGGVAVLVGPGGSIISDVLVGVNQEVKKGQPLARMSSRAAAQAEVDSIRLQLAAAQIDHANDLRLRELRVAKARSDLARSEKSLNNYSAMGVNAQVAAVRDDRAGNVEDARHALRIQQVELESQKASHDSEVKKLENRLASAILTLEQSELRAPFDGVVLDVRKRPGESSAGDVVTLADLTAMEVEAEVFEGDLIRLKVGQSATITGKSLPEPQKGSVQWIGRVVNAERKVAKALIRLDRPDLASRYIGMEVNVSVQP